MRRSSRRKGDKDVYIRFSQEEESMLLKGVTQLGYGKWKQILQSYKFYWKRTNVDLKDKYRDMRRKQNYARQKSSTSFTHSVGSAHSGGSGAPFLQHSFVPPPLEPPIVGIGLQPSPPGASSWNLSKAPTILPLVRKHCGEPFYELFIKDKVSQLVQSSAHFEAHRVRPSSA